MTRLDTVQRGATVGHHGTPWDTVGRTCLRCPGHRGLKEGPQQGQSRLREVGETAGKRRTDMG